MLDATTKRNIDAARNVLVGKVPDPKAQVEQITTALIYKFMDDLDKESVELGGEATFFTGNYGKFSWSKVIDTRLSGEGRLDLYVQAITSMTRNPNLPQLFRDIFKGAFLPYNDPQTLSLFLKEINKFTYGHSEELGNAFEYLLSILGSQGDAGQFRTPRHIIDFIVEVVDPQKTDTILDPACGTAGFLISAYKHIRKHNSSNFKPDKDADSMVGKTAAEMILTEKEVYTGDKLTPTERKKLTKNIQGYDISPDMVKLSLVNLYLHGFTSPLIFEYDTLSSEKRWGETFDVMLANPPFMTPKGGIRPHKRFQVQARRSEVLFVDYILEHLSINGRAGIIVPEGIIFKTDTAYKRLRQLLVDDGLFAVVSLPSGVFNPYAGVKTSILFFDNQIAKKTDDILFLKIENDGFGLGAQRRKIKENDLPGSLKTLQAWKKGEKRENKLALWVKKEKIAEDGDFNLTGERYRIIESNLDHKWPLVSIEEVCEDVLSGGTPSTKKSEYWEGDIPWVSSADIVDLQTAIPRRYITKKAISESATNLIPKGNVIVVTRVGLGKLFANHFDVCINQDCQGLILKQNLVIQEFLVNILQKEVQKFISNSQGSTIQGVTKEQLLTSKIPLPPLEVQQEIVDQIEVKQAVIDGAKAVIENYSPDFMIKNDWEVDNFENAPIQIIDGDRGKNYPSKDELMADGHCLFLNTKNVRKDGFLFESTEFISKEKDSLLRKGKLDRNDVVLTTRGTIGNVGYYSENVPYVNIRINSGMLILRPEPLSLDPEYLYYFLQSTLFSKEKERLLSGSAQPQLPIRSLKKAKLVIPPLEAQKDIVAQLKEEKDIIDANSKMIEIMENRIKMILEDILC